MKDIVIKKKTSDESQRIVLQTDSETLDYQSRFTVMTVTGNIEGLVNPFHVGSVTSLYEISQFLADNSSASIDIKKSVKATPYTVEVSHDGTPCTMGGNTSDFGDVSGTKLTISDPEKTYLMLDPQDRPWSRQS